MSLGPMEKTGMYEEPPKRPLAPQCAARILSALPGRRRRLNVKQLHSRIKASIGGGGVKHATWGCLIESSRAG